MNRVGTLTPLHRVSQDYVKLSATHPVRVGTYLYCKRANNWQIAEPPDDGDRVCGETNRIPHDRSVAPHDHDYYEIVFVRGGAAIHRTALYETPVTAGTVLVVAPGQVHAFDDIDGLQNTNVYYLNEWLLPDLRALWTLEGVVPLFLGTSLFEKPLSRHIPTLRLTPEEMDASVRELQDMVAEYERPDPSADFLKWCFQKLLLILARAHHRAEPDQPMLDAPAEVRAALERIEGFIVQGEAFEVSALAQQFGLKADSFGKLFKESIGWSPMDYFQRRRIHHASWLLLNAQHTITEVAHALGYCDSAHFAHLFKRHQGMSPREYRRKYAAAE